MISSQKNLRTIYYAVTWAVRFQIDLNINFHSEIRSWKLKIYGNIYWNWKSMFPTIFNCTDLRLASNIKMFSWLRSHTHTTIKYDSKFHTSGVVSIKMLLCSSISTKSGEVGSSVTSVFQIPQLRYDPFSNTSIVMDRSAATAIISDRTHNP